MKNEIKMITQLLSLFMSFSFISLVWMGCGGDSGGSGGGGMEINRPSVQIDNASSFEGVTLNFNVNLSATTTEDVTIEYQAAARTAEADVDFESGMGSITIPAGQRSGAIVVNIIDDEINEIDEKMDLKILSVSNADISSNDYEGVIKDNDRVVYEDDGSYTTADSQVGYNLVWSDEFTDGIDSESYTFEMGDGCPNLCGWGNNELQLYSGSEENAFIRDGALVIKAQKVTETSYNSARIITKGKRQFRFGRIDIRAKLPEGQGIWPAIWMLGNNIDQVGWPNCGEIDIMEMVGHTPDIVHGTAHWGPQGSGSTHRGNSASLTENFSEAFHVFTLLWEANSMKWYLDEELFHTITTSDVTNTSYPFNQEFFFIFNIAVGGNWPGSPDATTAFPQEMEIDYIRVFQE